MTQTKVREFNYGQWLVEITLVRDTIMGELTAWCHIDVTGNWYSTRGMLTDINNLCCYDEPEILPVGLKKIIRNRCINILKHFEQP